MHKDIFHWETKGSVVDSAANAGRNRGEPVFRSL